MRLPFLFVGAAALIAGADPVSVMTIRTFDQIDPGPSKTAYPNTPLGEEFGDMPWIVRHGSVFTAAYHIKDRNEGNPMWLEKIALYAQRNDGQWIVYGETPTWSACSMPISYDLGVVLSQVNLGAVVFAGYSIGDRINFRWYCRFRDAGCFNLVEKNQYFQVIKGEPLPLWVGQYGANLHNHSQYTDDILEWGGAADLLAPSARSVGLSVVLWTDHGYDVNRAECDVIASASAGISDPELLVMPGIEGNLDNNETNEYPDNILHVLANVCLRTPSEITGTDNYGTALWTLAQFQDSVQAAGGYWAAAHPFDRPFLREDETHTVQWAGPNINQALADPRFIGFQCWNEHRTSTVRTVSDDDNINPYPWPDDPSAQTALFQGMARLDESAVWNALLAGRGYLTNGPGCRLGVDQDNNGTLETTFGEANETADGGTIRCLAQSNGEFGPFTQAVVYTITVSSRDSTIVPLSGLTASVALPVSSIGSQPACVRVVLTTAGGYGDYPGLVFAGPIYFNPELTSTDDIAVSASSSRLRLEPNPTRHGLMVRWPANDVLISLQIVDAAGRLVWQAAPPDGSNSLEWGAGSAGQHTASSGVYFVTARFRRGQETQKFVLAR